MVTAHDGGCEPWVRNTATGMPDCTTSVSSSRFFSES